MHKVCRTMPSLGVKISFYPQFPGPVLAYKWLYIPNWLKSRRSPKKECIPEESELGLILLRHDSFYAFFKAYLPVYHFAIKIIHQMAGIHY